MKLPPLHALRAFDAVVKHRSVREAAEALFVTPGAITQQLRALEGYFGQALVERDGRGIGVTEAGRTLHLGTTQHLRSIAIAAEHLRLRHARVRVTAAHSVAVRWLVPKLQSFAHLHPDIEVMVDASAEVLDMRAGNWDVALREGDGDHPGHDCRLLFALDVMPVAAPGPFVRQPWAGPHLLHDLGNPLWQRWLDMACIDQVDASKGSGFSSTEMAIAAAVAGQGIALASPLLVARELASRTLVVVDPRVLVTGAGVHAVWPKQEPVLPAVRAFRRWLLATVDDERPATPADLAA